MEEVLEARGVFVKMDRVGGLGFGRAGLERRVQCL